MGIKDSNASIMQGAPGNNAESCIQGFPQISRGDLSSSKQQFQFKVSREIDDEDEFQQRQSDDGFAGSPDIIFGQELFDM